MILTRSLYSLSGEIWCYISASVSSLLSASAWLKLNRSACVSTKASVAGEQLPLDIVTLEETEGAFIAINLLLILASNTR